MHHLFNNKKIINRLRDGNCRGCRVIVGENQQRINKRVLTTPTPTPTHKSGKSSAFGSVRGSDCGMPPTHHTKSLNSTGNKARRHHHPRLGNATN
ncbi:unnamed protein product [Ceratitis capitata]|uniref:(Mediterranean fruit fly) hypothetical protein n=1 Tax=Ceratitis capitata TaxID=7213 RepID=A0A811V7C5_CERCA|nr:unnamed protein product [Ceratitis capitata]